jgi:hypothetical protein
VPVPGFIVILVLSGLLQTGCTSSRVSSSPTSAPHPAAALRQAGIAPGTPPAAILVCPNLGSSTVRPTLQATGGHRVILSWKASAPADSKHGDAKGYCVYRGIKRKDPAPVLVNSVPFPGTSCMDDLVDSDKKYYYVVRAISAKGITSIVSNEVPVAIPISRPGHPSLPRASVPLCREPATAK